MQFGICFLYYKMKEVWVGGPLVGASVEQLSGHTLMGRSRPPGTKGLSAFDVWIALLAREARSWEHYGRLS